MFRFLWLDVIFMNGRRLTVYVFFIFLFIVFSGTSAQANNSDYYQVFVNNKPITFDVSPMVVDGRTLIPVRNVVEAINALIEWEESSQTITIIKDKTTIVLTVNGKTAVVNGKTMVLDAPVKIIGSRTMIPLRFISENLGCIVGFDNSTNSIIINFGVVNVPNEKQDGTIYKTINFPNGEIYQGEIKNGKMHGRGSYSWPFGKKYIGNFIDGEIQGEGVMNFAEGNQYIGNFYKGLMHGNGKLIWFSGRVDEGLWHMGKYMGEM